MSDEQPANDSIRTSHDARNEFSKLLIEVQRRSIYFRAGGNQEEWLRSLEDLYMVIYPFISTTDRSDIDTLVSAAWNSIKISYRNSQGTMRTMQENRAENRINEVLRRIMLAAGPLLSPMNTQSDDDLKVV